MLLSASRLIPHHLLLLLGISESSNNGVITASANSIARQLFNNRFAVDVHLVAIGGNGGMENVELHSDDVRYRGLLVLDQKLLLVVPTYLVVAVYVDEVVMIDTRQEIDLLEFTLRGLLYR